MTRNQHLNEILDLACSGSLTYKSRIKNIKRFCMDNIKDDLTVKLNVKDNLSSQIKNILSKLPKIEK